MNELSIHFRTIKRADGSELRPLADGFNQLSFVQDMMEEGASNAEIIEFFKELARRCIAEDVPLSRSGYLDLVSFAADHGLLTQEIR